MPSATIRIARPTNDLKALTTFYTTAVSLQVIGSFSNHDGFDGVMLGNLDYSWHLEFTHQHGVRVTHSPTKEHLLVFYLEDNETWAAAVEKAEKSGAVRVKSENPYWDLKGATFEDPEGYRFVLQNAVWVGTSK